jgi:hypothetical protein
MRRLEDLNIDTDRPNTQSFSGFSFERSAWIDIGSASHMSKQRSEYGSKAKVRPLMDAVDLESLPAMMRRGRAVGSEASRLVIREHFAEEAGDTSVETVICNLIAKDTDAEAIPDLDHKAAALEAGGVTGREPSPSEIRDFYRVPGGVTHDDCSVIKPGEFGPSGNLARRPRAIPGDTLAAIIDSVPTAAVRG